MQATLEQPTKKGRKKMPRAKSDTYSRTVKFFNDEFQRVSEKVSGTIKPAATYEEASKLFGDDTTAIVDALNRVYRENEIAKAVLAKSGGMEERFILKFIKPFREIAPFNAIEKEDKQTDAILEEIRKQPFVLASLKAYCVAQANEGDEESES